MAVTPNLAVGSILTADQVNSYMINSGLTYIQSATFSGAGTKSINSCFSTSFTNYRIVVQIDSVSANSVVALRWRSGGSDNVTANQNWSMMNVLASGGSSVSAASSDTSWTLFWTNTTIPSMAVIEVCGPNKLQATMATLASTGDNSAHTAWTASQGGYFQFQNYQADGLTVFCSSGTMQGTITVYGYRQP